MAQKKLSQSFLNATQESLQTLLAGSQFANIYLTLLHATQLAETSQDFLHLLKCFEAIPWEVYQKNTNAGHLLLYVACRAREVEQAQKFLKTFQSLPEPYRLYTLWLKVYQAEQNGEPLKLADLDTIQNLSTTHLTPWEKVFYLRLRGRMLSLLKFSENEWQSCFNEAAAQSTGITKGLAILDEAHAHWRIGSHTLAQGKWAKALCYLDGDAYYAAWVRHDLAMSLRYTGDLQQAEYHLQTMLRFTRQPAGKQFQVRALASLGLIRCMLGDFSRAMQHYLEAEKIISTQSNTDTDDQCELFWGKSLIHRFLYQGIEAVQYIEKALMVSPKSTWLYADLAAGYLTMGDTSTAATILQQVQYVHDREKNVVLLVKSELLRLNNENFDHLMCELNLKEPFLGLEARCYPEIFEHIAQLGLAQIPPIQAIPLQVQVYAEGTLKVMVNGKDVAISTRGKAGLALVILLEQPNKRATAEILANAMYDDNPSRRELQKRVSAHIKTLRQYLGWEDSVQCIGGAYFLDTQAQWWYDIDEARVEKRYVRRFLEGMYTEWVGDSLRTLQAEFE